MFFGYSLQKRALVFPDPATGKPRFITARDLRRLPFPPTESFVLHADGQMKKVMVPSAPGWKVSDADLERALPAIDSQIISPTASIPNLRGGPLDMRHGKG